MDFTFTPEQQALRQEIEAWVVANLPPGWATQHQEDTYETYRVGMEWGKKLAARGWLCVGWPKEYGGGGWTHFEQAILNEVMGYHRAPYSGGIAIPIAGPGILIHGTEEQKKKYLSPIAHGEVNYCQGFTEPNAGSDLASLQTRAVQDGDYYVISGQKTFTSGAQYADYVYLMARTDPDAPKHRGISMFIVNMKSPGLHIRPLINMAGTGHQAETFYDEVRVPATDMVGEKNRGWYIAATSLDFERSGVGQPASMRRLLEEVIQHCQTAQSLGQPLMKHTLIRNKLAEILLELEVYRLLCWKVAWMQGKGLVPNYEASICNLANKEIRPKFGNVVLDIVGMTGIIKHGSNYSALNGWAEFNHRDNFFTHGQGAANIQRNIIAQRGLGLPR